MSISGDILQKYLAIIWMECHVLSVLKYLLAEGIDRLAQFHSKKDAN